MNHAIWAEGLVKRFGETTALAGVDLAVRTGTVLGLLGPNGAGKTTAVRVLTTLLKPDAGHASVRGHDVVKEAHVVRQMIGLTGQYAAVDETLTGVENLLFIGRLLGMPRAQARARAVELLEAFSLTDAGGRAAKTYSGGMRRRLDLAASLVGRPSVLFLDEPTTGLDPRARNEVWDMVRRLLATGVTVLLTTQYLEEADQLADEIAVVDHGRVIATGTPDELKNKIAAQTLQVRPVDPAAVQRVAAIVAEVVRSTPEIDNTTVSAVVNDPAVLPAVVRRLDDSGVVIAELALRSASLDEVFLALTGHPAEDENADDGKADDDNADDGSAEGEHGKGGDVSRVKRKAARKAKDDVLAGAPGDGADKKGTQR
jgi:oleandomycin transport system ATP-binding protein